jgi:hypothetical protein
MKLTFGKQRRKKENEPTLLDNLMVKHATHKLTSSNLLRLMHAQRFVLDEDASRLLGHLIKEAAPMMMAQHEFARPPFDPTWIEIDYPSYMLGLGHVPQPDDLTVDKRVGYFYGAGNLLFVTETMDSKAPMVMPYWFQLHHPQTFEEELQLAETLGTSRLLMRQVILGQDGFPTEWWLSDAATNFFRSHRLIISPTIVKELEMSRRQILNMLTGGAGSLKQGIALLLLLTRPGQAVIRLSEVGHRHSIIKGKFKTLLPHHKLTLHLSVPASARKVVEALHTTGIHHRFHSVRGHWAQTRKNVHGCSHSWEPVTVDRYHCLHCPAKRWWKTDHHRGDITLGTVTKDYDVKK